MFFILRFLATTETPVVTFTTATFPRLSLQSLVQRARGTLDFLPVNRLSSFHVIVLVYRLAICFCYRSQKDDHHQEKSNECRLKEEKNIVYLEHEIACSVICQTRETVFNYISNHRDERKTIKGMVDLS